MSSGPRCFWAVLGSVTSCDQRSEIWCSMGADRVFPHEETTSDDFCTSCFSKTFSELQSKRNYFNEWHPLCKVLWARFLTTQLNMIAWRMGVFLLTNLPGSSNVGRSSISSCLRSHLWIIHIIHFVCSRRYGMQSSQDTQNG